MRCYEVGRVNEGERPKQLGSSAWSRRAILTKKPIPGSFLAPHKMIDLRTTTTNTENNTDSNTNSNRVEGQLVGRKSLP